MKKTMSVLIAVILMLTSSVLAPVSAYSASKSYAQDKLIEIQQQTGFVNGKTAVVTGNCYLFVSKVCEKLYGVKYDGEGLYGNFRSYHRSGNYYTVATYTTTDTYPSSTDVEDIISFFTKNAAPGDIIHYGAYTTGTSNSNTHTFMVNSIDSKKMTIYHANYQTIDYSRDSCHIDTIYWDSLRKSPTSNVKNSDGSLYSMNAMFYNKMKSSGLGITVNRYTNYTSKYYLVGATVPIVKTTRSGSYSVKLTWDEIIGASKYQIQCKKSTDGSYTTLESEYTDLTYNAKNLDLGGLYTFRIRAYVYKEWKDWSDEMQIRVLPPTVSTVTFSTRSDGLYMQWAKRSDIDGTNVYRSDSASGTFELVRDVQPKYGALLDKNIEYGKTYYYKFERHLEKNGTTYKTTSGAKSASYTLETPTVSYVNTSTTSAEFTLAANGTTDKFVYYVTDANGKSIVAPNQTTSDTVSVKSLGACKAYRFYAAQKTAVGTGDYKRVSFRALPAKVKGVKASRTKTGIKVAFTGQSDASGYDVYRGISEYATYTKITSLDGADSNSYIDTGVKYGTTYYYKVCAKGTLKDTTYSGEFSDPASGKNTVDKPATPKAVVRTPSSFTIKWRKAGNASKYTVQYKEKGGKWKTVGTVTGTSKVVTGLKLGTLYYFRVKGANSIGSGAYSSACSRQPVVPKPKTPTAKLVSKGIKIYWNNESYATGYKIYRSTAKDGKYSLVNTVTNNSTGAWTDTSVSYGKNYYYKVTCYKNSGGKTYNSSKSDYVHKKYQLAVPVMTVEADGESANLSWSKTEGASKYVVQYRHDGGEYKSVDVTSCDLTVTHLTPGTLYYFRVKAVSAKGSSSYCTAQSVQF